MEWRPLTDGDVVVVVDADEVTQLQVTSHTGSLAGNTLHSASVTEEAVGVVGEQVIAGLVENSGAVSLRNGETNRVGETLAQGTGGDFDTGGFVRLRVTGSDASDLLQGTEWSEFWARLLEGTSTYSEVLEVIQGDVVAEQVKESILKHAAVAVPDGREVSIKPWIGEGHRYSFPSLIGAQMQPVTAHRAFFMVACRCKTAQHTPNVCNLGEEW